MTRLLLSREWLRRNITTVGPMVAAIAIIAGFQAINPRFLSYHGIVALVNNMSIYLIAACGLTFVIMTGSFDFSVVSMLRLAALLCALYIDKLGLLVIPLVLLISVGFGFINGLFVAKFNVPSFMATLGVSFAVDGVGLYLVGRRLFIMGGERAETFMALATTRIAGLPSVFYWAMGIWIISTFIALYTPFGRRTYALGGNPIGAGLSGINVERHRIYVFMLSGFLTGLAGVLFMAWQGGGSMEIGKNMPVPLFASVVAGGTALTGGVGGPHRTLLGVMIITWSEVGMMMLALPSYVIMVFFGLIAIGMSIATIDRRRIKIIK